MPDELVALYGEIARITNKLCSTCEPPFHCCQPAGCRQAKTWARLIDGIELPEEKGSLPFLAADGCTVSPHHRPLCAMWVCDKRRDDLPPEFFETQKKIFSLESVRCR